MNPQFIIFPFRGKEAQMAEVFYHAVSLPPLSGFQLLQMGHNDHQEELDGYLGHENRFHPWESNYIHEPVPAIRASSQVCKVHNMFPIPPYQLHINQVTNDAVHPGLEAG